jgi:hypothetical protein
MCGQTARERAEYEFLGLVREMSRYYEHGLEPPCEMWDDWLARRSADCRLSTVVRPDELTGEARHSIALRLMWLTTKLVTAGG